MRSLSKFPNLQLQLTKISLIDRLVQEILKLNAEETLIGFSIINAIETNTPPDVNSLFTYIKDMAKNNRQMIDSVIGTELTEQILSL